uniref:Uncharacterized protein n=1 Tax=Trichobilharzia regenti TaxID=157069 RepID=A0AA85KFC2_TRIRE|nr:unnamed protein product [Trichobilharzia regenti]
MGNMKMVNKSPNKVSSALNRRRNRFIAKVFVIVITQIFFTIFTIAIVESIDAVITYLYKNFWVSIIFSTVSVGITLIVFLVRDLQHKAPYNYLLLIVFTISFDGVITCLSIFEYGMFIFISWIIAISLSFVSYLFALKIKVDLTTKFNLFSIYSGCVIIVGFIVCGILYGVKISQVADHLVGIFILASVIPLSVIEGQMLIGGKRISYSNDDYILATMFHWILITLFYAGFMFQFLDVWLTSTLMNFGNNFSSM